MVHRGDTGINVRAVQGLLNYHGYHVKIDGTFTADTKAAVTGREVRMNPGMGQLGP